MYMIESSVRQTIQALLFVLVAIFVGACAVTIEQPADNATVVLPSRTRVVVSGNASFMNLQVIVNGMDFSSQMNATGPRRAEGFFILPAGLQTVTAIATMQCWYCASGTTQSTDTNSFVVANAGIRVCRRGGGVPVITLDPNLATVGQRPGRQQIGYQLQNGDGILILVDDAPGLLRTQMRVEVDLDPVRGVTQSKMIEAWDFCHEGTMVNAVTSGMAGGLLSTTGLICSSLTAANNFRSGCTTPTASMLINQVNTSELWLRKQGTLGNWDYAEAIDQSMWPIFGGRLLRFIWFKG